MKKAKRHSIGKSMRKSMTGKRNGSLLSLLTPVHSRTPPVKAGHPIRFLWHHGIP
jgi:hypothetical protein